jgi:hypothetical protein
MQELWEGVPLFKFDSSALVAVGIIVFSFNCHANVSVFSTLSLAPVLQSASLSHHLLLVMHYPSHRWSLCSVSSPQSRMPSCPSHQGQAPDCSTSSVANVTHDSADPFVIALSPPAALARTVAASSC